MSVWGKLTEDVDALVSDLSIGNVLDQSGDHGWLDALFFVFVPYIIIPLLLPLDLIISKNAHEWLHGKWNESIRKPKLTQATATFAIQVILAIHRSQTARTTAITFYVATCMPAMATLISVIWYAKYGWPPSTIRLYLCGTVIADLGRALGCNSLIAESITIRCYSVVAVFFGSRHLVWPGDVFMSLMDRPLHVAHRVCIRFIAVDGALNWLNKFIHFGLQSLQKQSSLPPLEPILTTADLSREFQATWEDQDKTKPEALREALSTTLFQSAVETVRPRLCSHLCQLYLVTLISRVVNAMSRVDVLDCLQTSFLVITAFLACIGVTTFDVRRIYANGMFDVKLRGILSSQILQKCMQLPASVVRSGEPRCILSAEVDQVVGAMPAIHTLWLLPAELAMTLLVFFFYNGLLTLYFFPLLIAALWVASVVIPDQLDVTREWNAQSRKQVAETVSIIAKVKYIRMMRLENMALRYLKRFEVQQVALSSSTRLLLALTLFSVIITSGILPIASLLVSTSEDKPSDKSGTTTLFTTVALTGMIAEPFIFLLKEGSTFQLFDLNLFKINEFLCQENHQDNRLVLPSIPNGRPEDSLPVSFCAASIAPSANKPAIFLDLNLSINPGVLTVVTGTTASGVSLFLKAIVGEAAIVSGRVTIRGSETSISYCPQNPWIFESTIVRAITGGLRYRLGLYRQVVVACMLGYDIDQLERLDNAPIGPGGSWFSIGLWQRIAIARAAYAGSKIVVIDNLFSTQSEQMACALFHRLLGPNGFFTKKKTTVILASNSVRHFNLAAKVIFIDEDHSILQATGQAEIESIVAQKLQTRSIIRDEDECEGHCTKPNEGNVHIASLGAEVFRQPLPANDGGIDVVGYAALWRLAPKDLILEWCLLLIAQSLFTKVPEVLIRLCIETISTSQCWIWAYILTICVRGILVAAEAYFQTPAEIENIHQDLVRAILRKPYDTLSTINTAWALDQRLGTSNFAGNGWKMALRASIHSSLFVLCDLIFIVISLPILLLILPLAILLLFWIHKFCLRIERQLRMLKCTANFKLLSILNETCDQIQNLRGGGGSDRQLGYLLHLLSQSQQVSQANVEIFAWRRMCQRTVSFIMTFATTSVALYVTPTYSGVTVGFVLFLSTRLWQEIDTMFSSILDLDHYAGTASSLDEFMKDVAPKVADNEIALNRQYRGAVEFKGVSVDRSTPAQTRTVLRGIDCKINPGDNIGVVGRAGSGRTTLFLTLLKQLPYKGSIKIDRVELSTIPHHKLNSIFTSISQRPTDLPGTVRDNIFPWDMATESHSLRSLFSDDEIYQLLDELDLQDYILGHGGLDAPVEDMHFTPGQRQLMAIATACFHHYTHETKIVLIDESTELLDPRTDNKAHRVIANAFVKCTKLFFAHRQDILRALDANMDLGDIGEDFRFIRNLFRPPAYATAAEYAEAEDHQPFDDEDIYDP